MPPAKKKAAPVKKAAAKKAKPQQDVTGPSSEPKQPLVTVDSPIAAPVIRSAGQVITGGFVVQGLEVFGLVQFTDDQKAWSIAALSVVLVAVQNAIESWRGRRLVGASR